MTLISVSLQALCMALLICVMKSKPVTQEHNNVYYDCCDVGLDRLTKENCEMARHTKDHVLTRRNGDTESYLWSSCRPGKEPWRKRGKIHGL